MEEQSDKFLEMKKQIRDLQKKNNLPLLEHKLCERMDDLVKAMCRTLADKFETNKRFRLSEQQMKQMFELIVMLMQDEYNEIRIMLKDISKNTMRNPATFLAHVKALMSGQAVKGGQEDIYQSLDDKRSKSKPVILQPTEAIRLENNLYKKTRNRAAAGSPESRQPGSRLMTDAIDSNNGTQRTSHREFTIRKQNKTEAKNAIGNIQ